jgi:photosystem II stability/assembly factor-like uncharacterized protein
MSRSITILILILATGFIACDQQIKSEYQSRFLDGAFSGDKLAWIVTLKGDLFRTEDAGSTWNKVSGRTIGKFVSIYFISPQLGWASNHLGQIWSSTDKGQTWAKIGALEKSDVELDRYTQLVFSDNRHGWLIHNSFIWRSKDGGYTWEWCYPTNSLTRASLDLGEGAFPNANTGWVGGDEGGINYTNDGGQSWNRQQITPQRTFFHNVFFISDEIGWVSGWPDGGIYQTKDGRKTWQLQLRQGSNDKLQIRSIYFMTQNEGWAVGQTWSNSQAPGTSDDRWGIVLNTVDGGKSWQQVQPAGKEPFYDRVFFSDSKHGWLFSRDKVFYSDKGNDGWRVVFESK